MYCCESGHVTTTTGFDMLQPVMIQHECVHLGNSSVQKGLRLAQPIVREILYVHATPIYMQSEHILAKCITMHDGVRVSRSAQF